MITNNALMESAFKMSIKMKITARITWNAILNAASKVNAFLLAWVVQIIHTMKHALNGLYVSVDAAQMEYATVEVHANARVKIAVLVLIQNALVIKNMIPIIS
jgi:hypothetical protein